MSTSVERLEKLSTQERRALLDEMLRQKARRERRFPLSSAQSRMWLLEQLAENRAMYNLLLPIRIEGALDVECLQRSITAVVARYEPLHTTFGEDNGIPYQIVGEFQNLPLEVEVLGECEPESREARMFQIAAAERAREFDLRHDLLLRARLLRLAENEHVLLITVHHIAFDGWSRDLLLRELMVIYDAEKLGRDAPLPTLEIQYADYAEWQSEWLNSKACQQDLLYWKERLSGMSALELPGDRLRPAVQSYAGAMRSCTISSATWDAVRSLVQAEGVTPFMVLFSVFVVLLHRRSEQDDVVVGSPVANRNRSEIEGLVGCFVNSLVLRTDVSRDPTFHELLARVRESTLDAYDHQELPFETLVKVMEPERDLSRNPLFQVMFALQVDGARLIDGSELRFSAIPIPHDTTRFDLECYLDPTADAFRVRMVYNTDLFEETTIDGMLQQYERILESVVADPEIRLTEIDLLGDEARAVLLARSKGKVFAHTGDVVSLFESAARLDPDALALSFGDDSLNYGEVDRAANRLAHRLLRLGVGREEPVGILLERSVHLVVAWLAVLKAGAAYLPMDPEYPPARLQHMLSDSTAPVLISQGTLYEQLSGFKGKMLRLDEDAESLLGESERSPDIHPRVDELAYVIYTSGSTGVPKGVAVSHGALSNLVGWHNRVYEVSATDRATQIAALSFDASVWEVWPYLAVGASVHIVDERRRQSPSELWQWLMDKRITLSFVPTPLAEMMLRESPPEGLALRAMLTGGDRLHGGDLPSRLPFRLVNHYGPTENAVVSTYGEVDLSSAKEIPPSIGWPVDNVQAYVLDERMGLLPDGLAGELYVGGHSLARGYWQRAGLTEERFVSDPFAAGEGSRLYRTGDRVRRRANGSLEFLGRVDEQVKVRGFRIELGEVEQSLTAHAGVREAVVLCRQDTPGDNRLVAYVVGDVVPEVLRAHMKERLPGYMLPSAFVVLGELPLTPNGKVDRAALPEPEGERQTGQAYVAPRTDTEQHIAAIWCEVLGVDRVGIDDNFFELGGHSLLAMQVVSRIRANLGVDLTLTGLFTRPTLQGLAEQIDITALVIAGEYNENPDELEEFTL